VRSRRPTRRSSSGSSIPAACRGLTTPDETLEFGFFDPGSLPRPFVPIHEIRVEDAMRGDPQVLVR
jgi:hypothetical protein